MHSRIFKLFAACLLAIIGFLILIFVAQTASAQDVRLDIDAANLPGTTWVTGGWVGQQVMIYSSTNGWSDYFKRWLPATMLTVTFLGYPLVITNASDDPVTMITDSNGFIPQNIYYFRVPKGIRGINQIVVTGQGMSIGQITTNSKVVLFYIATGIGATRATSPLPDWSKAAEKVGRNLIAYGTHFGRSGTDSGIVVSWDGAVMASGLSADSDGRWETTITIPETTAGSHAISATSIKLQSQGIRKPDGPQCDFRIRYLQGKEQLHP